MNLEKILGTTTSSFPKSHELAHSGQASCMSSQRIRRASRQAKRRDRLALGPASEHATEIKLALQLAQANGVIVGCGSLSESLGNALGSVLENKKKPVELDRMETYSLSSSCTSSLMSEMTDIFPELKPTYDSIEDVSNRNTQAKLDNEEDIPEADSRSSSKRQQILDEMVIEMLASKVKCQTLTTKDVGTFDRCKLIRNIKDLQEIGRGTYGKVLLARHIQTKKPLAIKQPCRSTNHHSPDETVDEPHDATRARVTKEAMVHELFSDSPFFPRFWGTLDADNDLCLALEFVGNHKSGTSFPLLEPPPLSVINGLEIAEDVVRGMMELHDHGLLHNDLKTDNVLLEKRGRRYHGVLIDFGMVCMMSSPLRMERLPETLKVAYIHGEEGDYVAPEVILDGQPTSVASDVFSVGRILEDITQVVKDQRSPLLKDISSLAIKCMKRNPEIRPNLSSILNQLGAMKTRASHSTSFWKRLVKKHR